MAVDTASDITLVVMVRDDHSGLARCLKSCRPVAAHRIVLVDREAPVETFGVASELGTEIVQYSWQDAFDLAINTVLPHVASRWTLRLDTDEWLSEDAYEPLLQSTASDVEFAYFMRQRNILEGGQYLDTLLIRLWRTHPLMRYEGVVHEAFPSDAIALASDGRDVAESGAWIWHDGYVPTRVRGKHHRNARLLEKALAAKPDALDLEVYLGVTRTHLDPARGLAMLEDVAVRCKRWRTTTIPCRNFYYVISVVLDNMNHAELHGALARWLAEVGSSWYPRNPGVLWSIANAQIRRGDRSGGLKLLLRLGSLVVSGTADPQGIWDPCIVGRRLWLAIASLYRSQGNGEAALEYEKRAGAS